MRAGKIALPDVERRPLAAAESALSDLLAGKVTGRVVLGNVEVMSAPAVRADT